jgi:hypothetical protein
LAIRINSSSVEGMGNQIYIEGHSRHPRRKA